MFIDHFRKNISEVGSKCQIKNLRTPGEKEPITTADFQHERAAVPNCCFTMRHVLPVRKRLCHSSPSQSSLSKHEDWKSPGILR